MRRPANPAAPHTTAPPCATANFIYVYVAEKTVVLLGRLPHPEVVRLLLRNLLEKGVGHGLSGRDPHRVVIHQHPVDEVDHLRDAEVLVVLVDKLAPRLPRVGAKYLLVDGRHFEPVLLEVHVQVVRAEHLGDFHELVVVVVPVEEGLPFKDDAREHAADAPYVQAVVVQLHVHEQLGALVVPARHPHVVLLLRVVELREAPVDEPQLPLFVVDHDVVRLHVAVHDAHAVRVVHCLEQLVHVVLDVRDQQRRVQRFEVAVVDVFKYERGRPALRVLYYVEQLDNVWSAAQVLQDFYLALYLLLLERLEYFNDALLLGDCVCALENLAVLSSSYFSHDFVVVRHVPHEGDVLVIPVIWPLPGVHVRVVLGQYDRQVYIRTGLQLVAVAAVVLLLGRAVELANDRVAQGLNLALLGGVLLRVSVRVLQHPGLGLANGLEDDLLVVLLDLLAEFVLVLHRALHGVEVDLESLLALHLLEDLLVLLSVSLGVLDHALNLLGGETALVGGNDDVALLATALLLSRHTQDTVGVNVEGDFDLGNTPGGGRNAGEVELAQHIVRRFTREHTSLHSRTVSDSLVRVDSVVGLLAEELLDHFPDLGDTGGTSDEDDLLDFVLGHLNGLENVLHGVERLHEQVFVESLELGPGEGLAEVQAVDEVFDFDGGFGGGRKRTLRGLDLLAQLLNSLLVLHNVNAVLLLEDLDEVVHNTPVKVLTSQVGVTSSANDLEDTGVEHEHRDIESTTSEIVHQDVRLDSGPVNTVRNGGGGGLVDDTDDLQTSDGTRVLGRLTLGVVEVRRHSDDGLVHLLTKVVLGDLLHLLENHGTDFLGGVVPDLVVVLDLDVGPSVLVYDGVGEQLHVVLHLLVVELATDESLDVEDGVCEVDGRVALSGFSHLLHIVGERDVRRGDTVSHFVGDDLHAAILVDADTAVGRTQVNTDDGPLDCEALAQTAYGLTLSRSGVGTHEARRQRRLAEEEGDQRGH
ncbi:NAD-specific glutamate dehydrogenase [Babesia caballi]|uniref:NAD-specific glutamate dehydrogenase n=1 Tax=Babesia caballi TaxID=5871 RepID=A0AAV4LQZ4_BABCB|nr:NAD-specific glutamate dehydrogenase [Babesia caballi]